MIRRQGETRSISGPAWVVLVGSLLSAIGTGATVPYLFSFLLDRGFDAGWTGALMTARAIGAVLGAVLGGAWVDKVGVHRAVVQASLLAGLSTLALLVVGGPWTGVACLTLYGAVIAAHATALRARLGQLTSLDERDHAFSLLYLFGNVGMAGGALAAGLVLGALHTSGYTVLYIVDGLTFVLLTVALWRGRRVKDGSEPAPTAAEQSSDRAGYREVIRDPAARWLCIVVTLVVAAGFSQLHVGFPALAVAAGVPASELGWAFAANMLTLVVVQSPVRRLTARWRRSSCVLVGLALMGLAWGIIGVRSDLTVGLLVVVASVFALGEVLVAPVMAAMVNDLAPESLRGRYNGAAILAWTGGWLAGTALTGAVLAAQRVYLLVPLFVLVLGAAALAAVRMRRHLPAEIDRQRRAGLLT
jgi:MFS family permease